MSNLNEIYPKLKNLDTNLNNLDGWALSVECFSWILDNIERGSNIIEIGSGSGTMELSKHYQTYALEHQERFTKLAPKAHYILAEIVDGWYDPEVVFPALPNPMTMIFCSFLSIAMSSDLILSAMMLIVVAFLILSSISVSMVRISSILDFFFGSDLYNSSKGDS